MPLATGQVTGYGDMAGYPYSHNLAPDYFNLFGRLKKCLHGNRFTTSCQHFATTISLRRRTNRINVRVAMQADFLREENGLKRDVPSTANTAHITITGCITALLF